MTKRILPEGPDPRTTHRLDVWRDGVRLGGGAFASAWHYARRAWRLADWSEPIVVPSRRILRWVARRMRMVATVPLLAAWLALSVAPPALWSRDESAAFGLLVSVLRSGLHWRPAIQGGEGDGWTAGSSDNGAALPLIRMNTSFTLNTGTVHNVATAGEFSTALTAQASQDYPRIVLTANIDTGSSFSPPARTGAGDCQIMSTAFNSATPPKVPGQRVTASDVSNLKRIQVTNYNTPVFTFAHGASPPSHYRLIGLEITSAPSGATKYQEQALIEITSATATEANLPSWIGVDRCYVHGVPGTYDCRRGIRLDGSYCYLLDSEVSGIRDWDNADSQGVAIAHAKGPLKIVNNRLQACGENFISGGQFSYRQPADIEFRYNWLDKLPAWEGTYNVKNHFELKFAARVYCYGNVMDYVWVSGQDGPSIVIKSESQVGVGDGAQYKRNDVVITHGLHRYYQRPYEIMGSSYDSNQNTDRIVLRQLVFAQKRSGTGYALFQKTGTGTLNGMVLKACVIETAGTWYTHSHAGSWNHGDYLTVENCVLAGGTTPNWFSGPFGAGGGAGGSAALGACWGGYSVTGNACRSTWTNDTVAGNTSSTATTFANIFTDYASGDYSIATGNWAKGVGIGGVDPGADWPAVSAAIQYTVSGQRPAEV